MERDEKIIFITIDLAKKCGLGAVTLDMIAKKIGVDVKELTKEFVNMKGIVSYMYCYFSDKAKVKVVSSTLDLPSLIKDKSLEEIMSFVVSNYLNMINDEKMFAFYKLIYNERATSEIAASILIKETDKMIKATEKLFTYLSDVGKLVTDDVESTAMTFAMSIHGIMDYQMDRATALLDTMPNMIAHYIRYFSKVYGK